MNEYFVSFELSKKLKDKGYPQVEKNTLAMYDEDGCLSCLCPTFDINRYYYCFEDFNKHDYVAPTISQVLKWLREEHATHIEISLGSNGWYFEIIQYEYYEEEKEYGCKLITVSVINDSYELTALAGIEYVIDNML